MGRGGSTGPVPTKRRGTARKRSATSRARKRSRPASQRQPRFVGRDPSPVLDRYPPREGASPPGLPAAPAPAAPRTSPTAPPGSVAPPAVSPAGTVPTGLIRLERPFDLDEFSQVLGETAIRVTVPRDALPEVLRRAVEFMGFGIYVYAISVRPAPGELLKGFVVELQRVDYDAEAQAWKPFVEKGAGAPAP